MARKPEQVLVLPFRRGEGGLEFAVFRRSDRARPCWQFVAGGVEDGETTEEAARRELAEEAGLVPGSPLIALKARARIPAHNFAASREWGPAVKTVPQVCFGAEVGPGAAVVLSREHTDVRWVGVDAAVAMLQWESNRAAVLELNERMGGL